MNVYVQFSDATEAEVISVLCGPQNEVSFPHQGVIADDDARYVAFVANFPTQGELVGAPE
ncbi:hypothetical protein [Herbaspirillum huttiense]|uniref:hypothetical protein n=1 Tax=Herbaspirillum huttiense TaxID=863372 RepID=UPI0031D5A2E3